MSRHGIRSHYRTCRRTFGQSRLQALRSAWSAYGDKLYLARKFGIVRGVAYSHRGFAPKCECWACRRTEAS